MGEKQDKAEPSPRRSLESVSSTRSQPDRHVNINPPRPVLGRRNNSKEYGDADIDHDEIEAVVPGHEFDVELGRVFSLFFFPLLYYPT